MTRIQTRNPNLREIKIYPQVAVRLLPVILLFAAFLPLSGAPPPPPPDDNMRGGMERQGNRRNSGIKDGVDLSSVGWIDDELTTQLLKKLEEAVQSHNQKLLDRYDRDGDGVLSAKEKKQIKTDISSSGNDKREPPDRNNSRNKSRKSSRQKDSRHSSSQQDEKNVDGVDLSKLGWIETNSLSGLQTQLKKAIERHNQNLLKRYDKNKNGKLDEDELAKLNSDIAAKSSSRNSSNESSSDDRRPSGPPPGESEGNGSGGPPPEFSGSNMRSRHGNGMGPGGDDRQSATVTAVFTANGTGTVPNTMTFKATKENQSAVIATKGSLTLTNIKIEKTGDTSSTNQSNFYGLNAAVLSTGGSIEISGGTIHTDAEGANAIFACGKASRISVRDLSITTEKNSSRGLDATRGGNIEGTNLKIQTTGAHCAALATDRGEGNVSVEKCVAVTRGDGSPGIYSTGNISAKNSEFTAYGAEAAVIEGKNSISVENCSLTGYRRCGIMLYQSFSGDAGVGTSTLKMTGGVLNAKTGAAFYITNTQCVIELSNAEIKTASGILVSAEANRWGRSGKNGGTVTLLAEKQKLTGELKADSISSITLKLGENTVWEGSVNADSKGTIDVKLGQNAVWKLTRNTTLNSLTVSPTAKIETNGFRVTAARTSGKINSENVKKTSP